MTDDYMLELARDAYQEIEYEEWLEHGDLKDEYLLAWYRETFYEEDLAKVTGFAEDARPF